MLEGLERGRWALAHKLHHGLIDEIGSVGAAELLLDAAPDAAAETAPVRSEAVGSEPLWRSLVPPAPRPLAQAARAGGEVMMSGVRLDRAKRPGAVQHLGPGPVEPDPRGLVTDLRPVGSMLWVSPRPLRRDANAPATTAWRSIIARAGSRAREAY